MIKMQWRGQEQILTATASTRQDQGQGDLMPPPMAEFAAGFCPPKIHEKKSRNSNNKVKSTLQ